MDNNMWPRITLKRVRPNPLFQRWLEDLYVEAKEHKSKLEPMLKEALDSLSKYPLPLKTGADCMILKGFRKKLCEHLDKRLEVYKHNLAMRKHVPPPPKTYSSASTCSVGRSASNSPVTDLNENVTTSTTEPCQSGLTLKDCSETDTQMPVPEAAPEQNSQETVATTTCDDLSPPVETIKRTRRGRTYVPAYRSGAYAILMAYVEVCPSLQGKYNKEELINIAQKYSEESFVRPKPGTFYTAWSSMSTLINKRFIKNSEKDDEGNITYMLTNMGQQLALKVQADYKDKMTANDIIFSAATCSSQVEQANVVELALLSKDNGIICLPPGSFDIILLIDKNETGGLNKKNDPTVAQFNKYSDLNHEYRSLKVGDFTWIVRHKVNKDVELVLPYVVERKRMDDLGASIKDGRFHEQKFRLRKCALNNVIYLIENYGNNKNVGLPIQHLMQALANTRIQDGFKVHITDSLTNSARFLAMMTKRLTIRYKDKDLKGRDEEAADDYLMTFDYFNKASSKSKALTVTQTFIKMLLQIKGVSVEKALAITGQYCTPRSLFIAYQGCERSQGESLLANLKFGAGTGRNVGPATSKAIYQVFSYQGGA